MKLILILALSGPYPDREIATQLLITHADAVDVAGMQFRDPEVQRRIEYIQRRIFERDLVPRSIYDLTNDSDVLASYETWDWDWWCYRIQSPVEAGVDFMFRRSVRYGKK